MNLLTTCHNIDKRNYMATRPLKTYFNTQIAQFNLTRAPAGIPGTDYVTPNSNVTNYGEINNDATSTYAVLFPSIIVAFNSSTNKYDAVNPTNTGLGVPSLMGVVRYTPAGYVDLTKAPAAQSILIKGEINMFCCTGTATTNSKVAVRVDNLDTTAGQEDVYGQLEVYTAAPGQVQITNAYFLNNMSSDGLVSVLFDGKISI